MWYCIAARQICHGELRMRLYQEEWTCDDSHGLNSIWSYAVMGQAVSVAHIGGVGSWHLKRLLSLKASG